MSRKKTTRVVVFAGGTALLTAALFAVAVFADDDPYFVMRHPPID